MRRSYPTRAAGDAGGQSEYTEAYLDADTQRIADLLSEQKVRARDAVFEKLLHPSTLRFLAARVVKAGADHIAAYTCVTTLIDLVDEMYPECNGEVECDPWLAEIATRTGTKFVLD